MFGSKNLWIFWKFLKKNFLHFSYAKNKLILILGFGSGPHPRPRPNMSTYFWNQYGTFHVLLTFLINNYFVKNVTSENCKKNK